MSTWCQGRTSSSVPPCHRLFELQPLTFGSSGPGMLGVSPHLLTFRLSSVCHLLTCKPQLSPHQRLLFSQSGACLDVTSYSSWDTLLASFLSFAPASSCCWRIQEHHPFVWFVGAKHPTVATLIAIVPLLVFFPTYFTIHYRVSKKKGHNKVLRISRLPMSLE